MAAERRTPPPPRSLEHTPSFRLYPSLIKSSKRLCLKGKNMWLSYQRKESQQACSPDSCWWSKVRTEAFTCSATCVDWRASVPWFEGASSSHWTGRLEVQCTPGQPALRLSAGPPGTPKSPDEAVPKVCILSENKLSKRIVRLILFSCFLDSCLL